MIAPFVSVQLDSTGPLYTYKNHVEGLEVGDVVVVCLPSGRFTCGAVQNVKPFPTEQRRATKYIVAKVDLDAWRALTALDPPSADEDKFKPKWLTQGH